MKFLFPGALLLLIPAWTILWRSLESDARVRWIRAAVLLSLALAAAGLSFSRVERGSDLIIVADRSLSMALDARRAEEEIIAALARRRGPGDRIGLVVFGRGAQLASAPRETGEPSLQSAAVDGEGSDLARGIELALGAIPAGRRARILVVSDGLATGPSPPAAASEALRRGIPIDVRFLGRKPGSDSALEDILAPPQVPLGTPFHVKLQIVSEREAKARARLRCGDSPVSEKEIELRKGLNEISFRDLPESVGIASYRAEIEVDGDPIPENNRGIAAVEVTGPKRILLVNSGGRAGSLARALSRGSLEVEVRGPEGLPASLLELVRYKAVILENVSARRLPPGSLEKLALFATDLGGGILLTGGRSSFGVGGYYLSALDPVLPVSMELRREHRKLSVAMAIALDRSGSMAARVAGGLVKMDLANMGACAAIELLSPMDQVAVLAVDTAAHVVVPLTEVANPRTLTARVRRIESLGGGIMTDVALEVAGEILAATDRSVRHLVLFADADDAEEMQPGNCARLIGPLLKIGATVSVIGLGTEHDRDAGLLKMIAEKTGGRVYFSDRAEDLPQIFAQETITTARATFLAERTEAAILPEIRLLGDFGLEGPALFVGGYNVTYLKPGASCAAVAKDEYQGPLLSFWPRGLGRAAALTAEVDGETAEDFLSWPRCGDLLVSLARYLQGESAPGVFVDAKRRGEEGIVTVEADPEDRAALEGLRGAELVIAGEGGSFFKPALAEKEAGLFEARFPLAKSGVYVGSLRLGDGSLASVPPISLPYSPEYAPERDPESGHGLLREIARMTGGEERLTWEGVFRGGGGAKRSFPVLAPLLAAALILHLAEVAARRLGLDPITRIALGAVSLIGLGSAKIRSAASRISLLERARRRRAEPSEGAASAREAAPPAPETGPPPPPRLSPFEQAKARARRRIGEKRGGGGASGDSA
ncbi:MAG: VWA domain-containing protein [Planctomycetota bacterium]